LFKGGVTHQEVPELLSAVDIFVLPTLNEGSCNAIFEALACGLPVVSSDIPAIKEQLNEKNSILCDPKNIDEIKNSILTLFRNEERVLNMKKSALSDINSSTERAARIKGYLISLIRVF
jgi:glycosyltransferase involved in cell wall biosynthesis